MSGNLKNVLLMAFICMQAPEETTPTSLKSNEVTLFYGPLTIHPMGSSGTGDTTKCTLHVGKGCIVVNGGVADNPAGSCYVIGLNNDDIKRHMLLMEITQYLGVAPIKNAYDALIAEFKQHIGKTDRKES